MCGGCASEFEPPARGCVQKRAGKRAAEGCLPPERQASCVAHRDEPRRVWQRVRSVARRQRGSAHGAWPGRTRAWRHARSLQTATRRGERRRTQLESWSRSYVHWTRRDERSDNSARWSESKRECARSYTCAPICGAARVPGDSCARQHAQRLAIARKALDWARARWNGLEWGGRTVSKGLVVLELRARQHSVSRSPSMQGTVAERDAVPCDGAR